MKKSYFNQIGFLKSFTLIAMMIMVPMMVQAQAKPNFSGTWTPNAEKSKLPEPPAGGGGGFGGGGGMGRMGGGDLVIKQEANLLTIETTRPGRDGGAPTTTTTKYTLDGKESVNAGGFGGDQKSTATWSADGKTLKISTTMDFGQGPMTNVVEWYMTDGILYQKRTMPSFDGGAEQTIINAYSKK